MTKKRLILISGFLAACGWLPVGAVAVVPKDHPGVTKANFDRIHDGMPLPDVEAILGKHWHHDVESPRTRTANLQKVTWQGDNNSLANIHFTSQYQGDGNIILVKPHLVNYKKWIGSPVR